MLRRNRVIDVFAHIRTCAHCKELEESFGPMDEVSDAVREEQSRHADDADEAAYEAYCDAKYDEMRGN